MAKEIKDKEKKNKKESTKNEKKKGFLKEFKAELKRVSWPTMKQLVNNTIAVIAIVLVISVTVFILDVIFESLNTYGVEKLKALVTSSSSETVEDEHNHDELVVSEETEVSNEAETTEDAKTTNETADTTETTTEDEATTEE